MPSFLKKFYNQWVLNFVIVFFSASIAITIWFLSFNLLIRCITLIHLHILKNPCLPGINPTWSWYMNLLICCWIVFARILLRIFASILVSDMAYKFLFLLIIILFVYLFISFCLYLVLVSGWLWSCKMSLEVFLPLQFLGGVSEK